MASGTKPQPRPRSVAAGRLVTRATARAGRACLLHDAWRAEHAGTRGGRALQWWLARLQSPTTRQALLRHGAGPLA